MNFEAFFKISYGLYIVSSKSGDKLNGYISNSVFQVTAEPANIAVTCNKDNHTASLIEESKLLSISVLSQQASMDLIGLFGYKSGKDTDKFENTEWNEGETGVPVVTQDTIATFECRVTQTFDVGTHLVFIGEVVNTDLMSEDVDPLTYAYYRAVNPTCARTNVSFCSTGRYDFKFHVSGTTDFFIVKG